MGFYDTFEAEVKKYFGVPEDADIHIDEDATYWEGCPTCGGTYEFKVNVWWYTGTGRNRVSNYKTFKGNMAEFLRQLD